MVNPDDEKSATFDYSVRYFRGGTAEELIVFAKHLEFIIQSTRSDKKSGEDCVAITRKLLQGEAFTVFENAVARVRASLTEGEEFTYQRYCRSVEAMIAYYISNPDALVNQTMYMMELNSSAISPMKTFI